MLEKHSVTVITERTIRYCAGILHVNSPCHHLTQYHHQHNTHAIARVYYSKKTNLNSCVACTQAVGWPSTGPDLTARIQDGDLITNSAFFDHPTACVQANSWVVLMISAWRTEGSVLQTIFINLGAFRRIRNSSSKKMCVSEVGFLGISDAPKKIAPEVFSREF